MKRGDKYLTCRGILLFLFFSLIPRKDTTAQSAVRGSVADTSQKPTVQQLTGVTIIAKKTLYEQKIDRLIINVANSITTAGNTALEILERAPGVVADHQNNLISMNGKDGVVVMINGKINHMPMSAVVQFLSGMNAGNIEKIELITTPPANLDAEGNAGYINIVLKENNNDGTNGSFSLTGGYSKGKIVAGSININHRKGKINLYGDLSYSRNRSPFTVNDVSRFLYLSNLTESRMALNRVQTLGYFDGRAGMDVQLSKQTILGVLLSGYDSYFSHQEHVQILKSKNGLPDTIMQLVNKEVNHWQNLGGNVNLQHTYNKEDKVSLNLDYIWYSNSEPVNYLSDFYNGNNDFLFEKQYRSRKNTPLHFEVAALDFSNRLTKYVSMEAGIKTTFSTFDNNIIFEELMPGGYVKDEGLSSDYRLKENYSAAYTSILINLDKKTTGKLGLRYEYTNSLLGTAITANIVDRHYGKFFPSLFLTHTINDKHSINFSYSRRISRPTFNDLAPYFYYGNPNTILTGNPSLQPSISNTIRFSYSFTKYLFTFSYSKEKNAIAGFQPHADVTSSTLILSPENLDYQQTITTSLSIPVTVAPWWEMQYNFTGIWQQVNAIYQKQPVRVEQINFQANGNMNFTLPKNFRIELSGFYQSSSLSGLTTKLPMGSMDAGIKKKLTGKTGTFTLAANNIFNTLVSRNRTDIPEKNLYYNFDVRFARRSYKLTYTRDFGNMQLNQKRERSTGAEEEKNRVQ